MKYEGTFIVKENGVKILEETMCTVVTEEDIKNSIYPRIQPLIKKKDCIDMMRRRLKQISMSI